MADMCMGAGTEIIVPMSHLLYTYLRGISPLRSAHFGNVVYFITDWLNLKGSNV